MLYSADRNPLFDGSGVDISSPWSFTLSRNQPLTNGFFNRIGTTEVVLEWCLNNISLTLQNISFSIDLSGGQPITVLLDPAAYTVAGALDGLVLALNSEVARLGYTDYDFEILQLVNNQVYLHNKDLSASEFRINDGKLARQLSLNERESLTPLALSFEVKCPDLRPYRYIDFVSEQITSVQDVKDASTADLVRDVLCRFYFSTDEPSLLDAYGFPILLGYTRFCIRRIFNPPKQIKWDSNLQVAGYLQFSVFGNDGKIITEDTDPLFTGLAPVPSSNWLMTLQLSEN
jgi:hypothetical protein